MSEQLKLIDRLEQENAKLKAQVERLREALEYYVMNSGPIFGSTAKAALDKDAR